MKKLFLSILLLCLTLSVFAQKNTGRVIIPESNLRFVANDDYTEVTITGFINDKKFAGKVIEIPSKIQGVPVTGIGDEQRYGQYVSVFGNSNGIKGLWIPDSIKDINAGTFSGATFESIRLPEGLETIKDYTFEGCKAKSIDIPSSVKVIMAGAFKRSCIESFTIPEGCEIGNGFDKTIGEFNVHSGHVFEGSHIKSLIFPKGRIYLYDEMNYGGYDYRIIGGTTFIDCDNLETIIIPEGLEVILVSNSENEYTLADFISGEKIEASFALQKQLKSVEVRSSAVIDHEEKLNDYNKAFGSSDYERAAQIAKDFINAYSAFKRDEWTDRYLLACKEIYNKAFDSGDYGKAIQIADDLQKNSRYKYYGSKEWNTNEWKEKYLAAYEKKCLDDYYKAFDSGDYKNAILITYSFRDEIKNYNTREWNDLYLEASNNLAFTNGMLHTNLACNIKGLWLCMIDFAEKKDVISISGFRVKNSDIENQGLKAKDVIKEIILRDSSGKESEVSWKDLLVIKAPATLIFTVERGSGKKAQTLTISVPVEWNADEIKKLR